MSLNSSFVFWDKAAFWIGIVGLTVAVSQIFIEFTDFVSSDLLRFRLRVAFAIALVATAGGQLTAQVETNTVISAISEYLNKETAEAKKLGNEAKKRTAETEN